MLAPCKTQGAFVLVFEFQCINNKLINQINNLKPTYGKLKKTTFFTNEKLINQINQLLTKTKFYEKTVYITNRVVSVGW